MQACKFLFVLGILIIAATASAQSPPNCLRVDLKHPQQIQINWQDNSNNEDGFILERQLNGGPYGALAVGGIGANITQYIDGTVIRTTTPNTYTYRLTAFNTVGESDYSNEACATFDPIPTKPAAPSGVTLSSLSSSQIQATWRDNSENETGFILTLEQYSPPRRRTYTAPADTNSLIVNGLQKNKSNCGWLVAMIETVASEPSNDSCTTTRK